MVVLRGLAAVVVCAVFAFAQEESAQAEKSWSLSLNGGVVSKYLWRGFSLHDGPAFHPSIEFSSHGLTAGFWESYNFGDEETSGFAEADYYVSYAKALPFAEACELSLGYSHYTYPTSFGEDGSWNGEWSVGLSYDAISAPTLTYYVGPASGYDGLVSQYLDLGLSHEFGIMENLTANPTLNAGFGMYYDDIGAEWLSDLSVLGIGASATYSHVVDITPELLFQVPLSDGYENDFYFGLSIGYEL